MDTVWILTEERPKTESVIVLLENMKDDFMNKLVCENIKIKPIIKNSKFQFRYIVKGVNINVYLKLVSGNAGSFVDHLIFHQTLEPKDDDCPKYVIEETKTNSDESRNVAVYQRLTKFVFLNFFDIFKTSKRIMLYNRRIKPSTLPNTLIFGNRLMKTLDIKIIDKYAKKITAFENLDELILSKNRISENSPSHNIPLTIKYDKELHELIIAGKLEKSGKLGHDPNMGAITGLSQAALKLEPNINNIIVKNHGVTQEMIDNSTNKFIKISTKLGISLDGLKLPTQNINKKYWKYTTTGEKIVSILFHIVLEYYGDKVIYDNHASSEQGYFEKPNGTLIPIPKKTNKPDIIFIHDDIIYIIEAEKSENVFIENRGISQLSKFDNAENDYCKKYELQCKRYVVCYGDELEQSKLDNQKVLFQLKTDGEIVYSTYCPDWIKNQFTELESVDIK